MRFKVLNNDMIKNQKNILKENIKGITLIALVVTIIVLLILAGVAIATLTGDNGILKQADKAKTETTMGKEKEAIGLAYNGAKIEKLGGEITAGDLNTQFTKNGVNATAIGEGTIKVSFPDTNRTYVIDNNGMVSEFEPVVAGGTAKLTVKDNYTDGTNSATIPKGFTVSNIKSEQTISTGLVIYDIPEGEKVEWDSSPNQYNQFVWIPVSEDNYNRTSFGEDLNWGYYKEPDNMANNTIEYENIREQIFKYGGFYIARYESSFFMDDNESIYCKSVPSIKYSEEEWAKTKDNSGMLFNYITWREAMKYSNEMYKDNTDVKSNFLFGTQWDSILKWIEEENNSIIYEEQYGNYTGTLINSGQNTEYSVNNIYDLAGNLREWTQEFQSWSSARIVRGSCYMKNDNSNKMVTREYLRSTVTDSTLGFRVSLTIQ